MSQTEAAHTWLTWCSDRAGVTAIDTDSLTSPDSTGERASFAKIIADLWRIDVRAKRVSAPEPVLLACERAFDSVAAAGFEIKTFEGEDFDPKMKVEVVDREGGDQNLTIVQCLTPAVYLNGVLVSKAAVVVRGTNE
ncbi:MAG: hypothetical protein M3R13_06855 [Armatimonadota bacterium]|nr:hypothetical protein [Armatimonadota bacterium]